MSVILHRDRTAELRTAAAHPAAVVHRASTTPVASRQHGRATRPRVRHQISSQLSAVDELGCAMST